MDSIIAADASLADASPLQRPRDDDFGFWVAGDLRSAADEDIGAFPCSLGGGRRLGDPCRERGLAAVAAPVHCQDDRTAAAGPARPGELLDDRA